MPWWQIQDLMITAAGILIVLIPVTGLTLRFAVKPFLKDLGEARSARQGPLGLRDEEQDARLARIETQSRCRWCSTESYRLIGRVS